MTELTEADGWLPIHRFWAERDDLRRTNPGCRLEMAASIVGARLVWETTSGSGLVDKFIHRGDSGVHIWTATHWRFKHYCAQAETAPKMTSGGEAVVRERVRQIVEERNTAEIDDLGRAGRLAGAAVCYARLADRKLRGVPIKPFVPPSWPMATSWWKPATSARRALEKAGALIIAELDRMDRREQVGGTHPDKTIEDCKDQFQANPGGTARRPRTLEPWFRPADANERGQILAEALRDIIECAEDSWSADCARVALHKVGLQPRPEKKKFRIRFNAPAGGAYNGWLAGSKFGALMGWTKDPTKADGFGSQEFAKELVGRCFAPFTASISIEEIP